MSVEYIESDLREPLVGKASSTLKEANIFKICPSDLKQLFYYENTFRYEKQYMPQAKISKSLHKFRALGGTQHFLDCMLSEPNYGIIGDSKDIARRVAFFGNNYRPIPEIKSFQERVLEAATTGMMKNLIYTATIAMVLGLLALVLVGELQPMEKQYFLEGISIYLSILFVTLVSASDLYLRDQQFQKLVDLYRKEKVPVLRGRQGYTTTTLGEKLVVGDIIFLDEGQRVPADCILLSTFEMACDEAVFSNSHKPIFKKELTESNFQENPNPFLFSQTLVVKGQGKALVCAVGANSFIGSKREVLTFNRELTPTQLRLTYIAERINLVGMYVAVFCFGALIFHMALKVIRGTQSLITLETLQEVVNHLSCCISLVIVAFPEGLPLAVSLGVAFQVQYNKALIRSLAASEKLGGVQDILFSKTGVLTQNKDLKVSSFYTEGYLRENTQKNKFQTENLHVTRDLIVDNILMNTTDCRLEMDENARYFPEGNPVDCCLIEFLQDNEIQILTENEILEKILCRVPFSSQRIRSLTVFQHPEDENLVRVLSKGAPEILLDQCTKVLEKDGKLGEFTQQKKGELMQFEVIEEMALQALKPIAMAYKDLNRQEFEQLKEQFNNFQSSEDIEAAFENELTFVAVFGIEDPLREGIEEVITRCKESGVTLRLVTNENIHTARGVAIKVGLIDEQTAREEHVCIDGEIFRDYVGGFKEVFDEYTQQTKIEVVKKGQFKALTTKVRVMARCDADIKAIIVAGLTEEGPIAITGSGVNDMKALQEADVGLSLGNRMCSEASKDSSDIVLLSDDFNTILESLMWGRAIYLNVRKFLQLQVTMNIVIMVVQLVGSFLQGDCPLTPSQLLWINIIMDTLGVLALSTEPPSDSVLTTIRPLKRNEQVTTSAMKRNIILSASYQIIVILIILFFGDSIFSLDNYDKNSEFYDKNGMPTDKCYLFTIIFNCLTLQTIFQMINARKTGEREFNIFENIFGNWIFVAIFVGVLVAQVLFVQVGGTFLRCAPLSFQQSVLCLLIGASVLVVIILVKLVPSSLFDNLEFNEERPVQSSTNKDYQIFEQMGQEELKKLETELLEENSRIKLELREEHRQITSSKFVAKKTSLINLKDKSDQEQEGSFSGEDKEDEDSFEDREGGEGTPDKIAF